MHYYKRQESFRYTFYPPIKGTFQIVKKDGQPLDMKPGAAEIIDLSPNGLRLSSDLHIPIRGAKLEVIVTFTLNETPLSLYGSFVWKKPISTSFHYGVECTNSFDTQEMIIREIKQYIKTSM
jgi:hypothetical protein